MVYWTIQDYPAWENAQKLGYLTGSQAFVEPEWVEPYQWLVKQMQVKLNLDYDFYPVWMWDYRPDLRQNWSSYPDNVLLRIEIDDKQVVASDYDTWHCVLMNSEITLYEDEVVDKEESWQRVFDFTLQEQYPEWLGSTIQKQYTTPSVPLANIKMVKRFKGRTPKRYYGFPTTNG